MLLLAPFFLFFYSFLSRNPVALHLAAVAALSTRSWRPSSNSCGLHAAAAGPTSSSCGPSTRSWRTSSTCCDLSSSSCGLLGEEELLLFENWFQLLVYGPKLLDDSWCPSSPSSWSYFGKAGSPTSPADPVPEGQASYPQQLILSRKGRHPTLNS